jgi:hypothetical protein
MLNLRSAPWYKHTFSFNTNCSFYTQAVANEVQVLMHFAPFLDYNYFGKIPYRMLNTFLYVLLYK